MGMMLWTTMDITCRELTDLVNEEKIGIWLSVQRGEVWDIERNGLLIDSIINSYLIPAFTCERRKDGTYSIIDAQQRTKAITGFINDEYVLPKLPIWKYKSYETKEIVEFDPYMKRFSELPKEIQDIIYNKIIHIDCVEDISQEQKIELYRRLNNGKALSTKDRNIAYCEDLEHVIEIGKHEVFKKILTSTALRNRKHVSIIMKVWSMLYGGDEITFESRFFNEVIKSTIISSEQEDMIIKVLDMMLEIYNHIMADRISWKKYKSKFKSETNFVAFVPIVREAIEEGKDSNQLYDFFKYFFGSNENTSISDDYNDTVKNSSAKRASIRRRTYALKKAWKEFFE